MERGIEISHIEGKSDIEIEREIYGERNKYK